MKLIQITVSYGATQSLPEYSNVKPNLTLTATLDEGDDPAAAEALLWQHAKDAVHEQIDSALESNDQAAKYSDAPRYQVMRTYWDSYANRGKPEQSKIVVILPNEFDPDTYIEPRLVHAGYHASRKLRYNHALRIASQTAGELGATLIDCASGDLAPLIAALAVAPAPIEQTPESRADERRYEPEEGYREIDDDDEELDQDAEEDEREHEMTSNPEVAPTPDNPF